MIDINQLYILTEDPDGYWSSYDLCLEFDSAMIELQTLSWWQIGEGSLSDLQATSGVDGLNSSHRQNVPRRSSILNNSFSCLGSWL